MGIRDIKVYPEISRATIKYNLDTTYRMWLIARHLDAHSGKGACGWVPLDQFNQYLRLRNLTKAHLRKALSNPQADSFIRIVGDRVKYASLEKVSIALIRISGGDFIYPGKPAYIPANSLDTLSGFRAWIYAAWHVNEVEISRERKSDLFGITDQTQRNWEKKVPAMHKEYNWGSMPEEEFDPALVPLPRDSRWGKDDRNYFWVQEIDGRRHVCWQTVNTYHADIRKGNKGLTSRIKSRLRAERLRLKYGGETQPKPGRVFHSVSELPVRPERIEQRPCLVKLPGVVARNSKRHANVWLLSLTTPVGSKRGVTGQELNALLNGKAFWERSMREA